MQSPSADGWIVYEPETDSLHMLNESARAIWELCDGQTTPEEIVSAIAELTGLTRDESQEHVETTLAALGGSGLVVFA